MTTARRWVRVLGPDELAEGGVAGITCEGRRLCVTRIRGRYGALDDRCPHRDWPLSTGRVEGGRLQCAQHGWVFDPVDGTLPGGFPSRLRAHAVEERPDGVYVAVDE
jgi:pyruvate oxidase